MKKFLILILVVSLVISMGGCGKSEATIAVDNEIEAIGEINLNSGDELEKIGKEIEALDERDKAKLENLQSFEEAKKAYDEIVAATVIDLIDEIGEVTLKKEKRILKAENAYKNLTLEQQKKVTNYNVLKNAKSVYEQKQKAEKEKRGKAALKALNKSYDKVEGITWYDKFPQYINTRSYALPFIGVQDDSVFLFVRYNYTGDNWIFWNKLIIVVDGEKIIKTPDYFDITRGNDLDVWEYLVTDVSETDLEMFKKIVDSKEAIVRFMGDDKRYDLTIKSSDKKTIQTILEAYDYLNS